MRQRAHTDSLAVPHCQLCDFVSTDHEQFDAVALISNSPLVRLAPLQPAAHMLGQTIEIRHRCWREFQSRRRYSLPAAAISWELQLSARTTPTGSQEPTVGTVRNLKVRLPILLARTFSQTSNCRSSCSSLAWARWPHHLAQRDDPLCGQQVRRRTPPRRPCRVQRVGYAADASRARNAREW